MQRSITLPILTTMHTPSASCPDCGMLLASTPSAQCDQCRLPLVGPDAAALWQISLELAALDERRRGLAQRHGELLTALRARRNVSSATSAPACAGAGASTAREPAPEVSAPSARTALLALGGLLVVVAAVVFTVVSWGRLGIGGRAAVLFAVTACALVVPRLLRRRRLTATAEASAMVGLALVLLDAYAARQAGLGGLARPGTAAYWAVVCALMAVGTAGYGWRERLRLPLPTALVLAQLPGPLGVAAVGGTAEDYAAAAIATAALDFLVVPALAAPRSPRMRAWLGNRCAGPLDAGVRALGSGWALLGGALAAVHAVGASSLADVGRAGVPLGLLALLGLALCRFAAPFALRAGGQGVAVMALLVAVGAGTRHVVPSGWAVVGYGAPAGLVLVCAAVRCARRGQWVKSAAGRGRVAPQADAAALGTLVAASTLLFVMGVVVVPAIGAALTRPVVPGVVLWVDGHLPRWSWHLDVAPLIVLWLIASVVGTVAALRVHAVDDRSTDQVAKVLRNAAVLVAVPAVLLLPVAVKLPYPWVLAAAAAVAVGVAEDLVRRRGAAPTPRILALVSSGGLSLLWAVADRAAVLAVAVVFAVSAAVLAHVLSAPSSEPVERATATAAGVFGVMALGIEATAAGITAGLPLCVTAFVFLAVAVASGCAAAAWRRVPGRTEVSVAVEVAGYALAAVALAAAASEPEALSLALALSGVALLAVALRPDRRRAALVGTGVLIASSWVRLALADVAAPEAYTLTVTAAALIIGHRRRLSTPGTGSWAAYGTGLTATMIPSLPAMWSDPNWLRPLLLGSAALFTTFVGVRARLQAPLVVGGAVLLLVGWHELAPAVVQVLGFLPRWVPVAGAGLILLLLGATYEQRAHQARRLRDTLRSMV